MIARGRPSGVLHLLTGGRHRIQPDDEKKIVPAAALTPTKPAPEKLAKWSAWKALTPITMNRRRTPTLIITMIALTRRTRTPRSNSSMQSRTRITAGRLISPPVGSPSEPGIGETESASGNRQPNKGIDQLVEVTAPADCHGSGRHAVLQQHTAGDDHGHELAEGVVGVE